MMEQRNYELENENITKLLVKYSTPAIIGMVTNSLYNLVDTIVVGRGVGTLAIGGLAICFPIMMLSLAIGMTVGIGSSSIVSRSLGAKDYEKAYKVAGNSFAVSFFLGLIMTLLGIRFIEPLLKLFGSTDTILPYAKEYMQIVFLGMPFFAFSVSSNNIVRAEGSPFIAMVSMMVGTVLNIILDPIFVLVFHMGIKGVAYATIISQIVGFLFLLTYFITGKSKLHLKIHHLLLDIKILGEVFAIGFSSLVRQAAMSLLAIVLNNSLRVYGGDVYIAIYGIINRIVNFLFMPVFGVVQGLQPIIGFNYGAKKMNRVKKTFYQTTLAVTVMLTFGWAVLELFPGTVMSIFSSDAELIRSGAPILRIMTVMLPLLGIQMVGSTYFQAVGKALPATILSMSRQLLFFIPIVLLLPLYFGLSGIWATFPISDILAVIITLIWVIKELRHLSDDTEEQGESERA